ncbi:LysR family transcriptional regulator [Nonomuraea sp. NPDC049141]|uniref:LysR family transcriptional regulator n=1 Tax=Nonomuraea sp. NPDC049141 TaxID=3155500 RepID=UPI0033DA9307
MDHLEVRELLYFIALAEKMHFSRAAEQLGIAQPALSRAISRLERRMGVQLFERTSRRVSLTEAGEVLLRESRKVLAAADGAVRRAQRAARPQRLVIAAPPGTGAALLSLVLDAYRSGPDPVPVEVLFTVDLAAALRDGTADLALMCGSDDLDGLDTVDLLDESPVALLPAGHPLAARGSLTARDVRADTEFREQPPRVGLDEDHRPGRDRRPRGRTGGERDQPARAVRRGRPGDRRATQPTRSGLATRHPAGRPRPADRRRGRGGAEPTGRRPGVGRPGPRSAVGQIWLMPPSTSSSMPVM